MEETAQPSLKTFPMFDDHVTDDESLVPYILLVDGWKEDFEVVLRKQKEYLEFIDPNVMAVHARDHKFWEFVKELLGVED